MQIVNVEAPGPSVEGQRNQVKASCVAVAAAPADSAASSATPADQVPASSAVEVSAFPAPRRRTRRRQSAAASANSEPACVHELPTVSGYRPRELARRYRVSISKIHAWIRSGELRAINTAAVLCGKPQFVVLPEALADFERRRDCSPPPKPERRRRQPAGAIDFFPDW
jgi:hypothetical protein